MAWGDNRNDLNMIPNGIYAQNINVNGGIGPASVSETLSKPGKISIYPNPCKHSTFSVIQFTEYLPC